MENTESALKTKLKQLEKGEEKTNQVLKGGKQTTIQRQLTNLKELVTEADNARRVVEALKIEAKVSDGEVTTSFLIIHTCWVMQLTHSKRGS